MNIQSPYVILGIKATASEKEIKKAYAKLVKKYHPEEHPQMWKEIHDAYLAALQYAKSSASSQLTDFGNTQFTTESESVFSDKFHDVTYMRRATAIKFEEQEVTDCFLHLGELSKEAEKKDVESSSLLLEEVEKEFKRIKEESPQNASEWEHFFGREEYRNTFLLEEFLLFWADALNDLDTNKATATVMKNAVDLLECYAKNAEKILSRKLWLDNFSLVRHRINASYNSIMRKAENKSKFIGIAIIIVVFIFSCIWYYVSHYTEIEQSRFAQKELEEEMQKAKEEETLLGNFFLYQDEIAEILYQQACSLEEGFYLSESAKSIDDRMKNQVPKDSNITGNYQMLETKIPLESTSKMRTEFSNSNMEAYTIIGDEASKEMLLWCTPEALDLEKDVHIFYYDHEKGEYQELFRQAINIDQRRIGKRQIYQLLGCYVFRVEVFTEDDTEQYPIIFVNRVME